MRAKTWPPWRRGIERALLLVGVVCISWTAFILVQTRLHASHERNALARLRNEPAPPPAAMPIGTDTAEEPLTGLLVIPRLGVSGAVAEGDDEGTLRTAIGHLSDTSVPWRPGNTALAAHRDVLFRALRNIRIGDEIRLATPRGDFEYRVQRTLIVNPDDMSVLAPTSVRQLTLITCYPFSYIGHAPQRFIVTADAIDP